LTSDKTGKQRKPKEIDLNNAVHQLDPIDMYGVTYPTTAECMFLSSAHRTFTRLIFRAAK
jgi:hypothetical protein